MGKAMNLSAPLSGIKVLDATQGVAGPHAGLLFAQHGAEVTKLEPLDGDWGRTLGKRYDDFSAHAITFNRGKRSIALDLKAPEGREIALKLAAQADVVLENFRPNVMKRLGLGYEDVRAKRPDVIYLSITGYGQSGPYSSRPVTDTAIQAFSGWMMLHRDAGGVPMRSGMVIIDAVTGLYAYQAAVTALLRRIRFGEGAYVDCSLVQSAAALQAAKILEFQFENGKPEVNYVPVGVMPTENGFISIAVMRDDHYTSLCDVLERPDLNDERYDTRDKRRAKRSVLMPELMSIFRTRTTEYWADHLTKAGVINARINDYADMLADTHVKATKMLTYADHENIGIAPVAHIPGVTAWIDDDSRLQAPRIGQHTSEILLELGYGASEIDTLRTRGIVHR
jgi:crotonobetainyl-CoA:carnitine CoA-transferase CaiB-like acyl-CoA transferase